jgi:twitching motility protein PilI
MSPVLPTLRAPAQTDAGAGHAPDGTERRNRLRQYQVQLIERMHAAKSIDAASGKALGVLIGGQHCLLDLTQVGEIVPAPAITVVPLAREWYLGLSNVRGSLTGIIDLARYRGEAGGAIGADSRLVTLAPWLGFNCALLVTRVLGLRDVSGMLPATPAPPVDGQAPRLWLEQDWADAAQQRWDRIDLAELVREPRFLQVGY